ncbi:unnamed protein product [Protopolystoma xenopodis]|uniref:Uncharacterized protein n=1 Tax=Protopolystoma xenopodis TaxID=117903 RepID=A0A448XMN6_9PLAT|nr:unnamed protein product [Protopolystoma xenopodis]
MELHGNTVGSPAKFTVDTFSAGRGSVEVIVLNPKGQREPVCCSGALKQISTHAL